ncbi:SH3 domain-containing protein [Tessaracoccus antarcticus]|uniref:SH3 domain-containing protein n=1 Tax=Tessaracoccus antarcticus TaxID=2479848 RepID=A0A3M0GBQ4_9ACTN|nr:SH3 domain-containing protein [Tessaracoccus antarcticus]RMB61827.1 SH3 domain-containing protein [Tessaracoccus antarcticus]
MSHARRAAVDTPEVTVPTEAPRRGHSSAFGPAVRRAIAPTAIVALLAATATLTFVPMGGTEHEVSVADPLTAHDVRTANRASREFTRTAAPAAVSVVPSMMVPTPSISAPPAVAVAPPASPVASASPSAPAASTSAPVAVAAAPAPAAKTPAVDWSVKGAEAGTRWITKSVNVRTGPGTSHDVVTAFVAGRKVTITKSQHDGWQQVSLKNGAGWVKASFLTSDEPAAPATASGSSTSSSSSNKAASGVVADAGSCPRAGSATNGMQSRTISVLRKVCAQFPNITSYGGYRAGSSGYHGSGRAIDAMISGDAGLEVARWVRANASSLGVVEVIYQQKIWTSQRSGDGWRSMASRGSASADHYDHVHISVG